MKRTQDSSRKQGLFGTSPEGAPLDGFTDGIVGVEGPTVISASDMNYQQEEPMGVIEMGYRHLPISADYWQMSQILEGKREWTERLNCTDGMTIGTGRYSSFAGNATGLLYAVGQATNTTTGEIKSSSDLGETWSAALTITGSPATNFRTAIYNPTTNLVLAGGSNGVLVDISGNTVSVLASGTTDITELCLDSPDGFGGVVLGVGTGAYTRSTDGGLTWTSPGQGPRRTIARHYQTGLWMAGSNSAQAVQISTNNGASWTSVSLADYIANDDLVYKIVARRWGFIVACYITATNSYKILNYFVYSDQWTQAYVTNNPTGNAKPIVGDAVFALEPSNGSTALTAPFPLSYDGHTYKMGSWPLGTTYGDAGPYQVGGGTHLVSIGHLKMWIAGSRSYGGQCFKSRTFAP